MAQLYPRLSEAQADDLYLKLDASNDPVTNEVEIDPSSDTYSIHIKKDMRVKSGEKIFFDA